MPGCLGEALRAGRPLLMDGAMGTALIERGADPGECLAAWNLSHPDQVAAVHRAHRAAGADVLLTNTFQAYPAVLERYGLADRHGEIVRAGLRLARAAAGENGLVLAAFGPPPARLTLKEAGRFLALVREADGLLLETLSEAETWMPLLDLDAEFPVLLSFTFGHSRQGLRTAAGLTPEDCADLAERLRTRGVQALGTNCGRDIRPGDMVDILGRCRTRTGLPLFARPNAGQPEKAAGSWRYPMSPEEFVRGGRALRAAGATLLGGCCGTGPEHLAALGEPIREG